MFKYVWIIMLVIAAIIFIGYTIYAIYDSYCESVRWAIRAERDYDIKWILSETLNNLWHVHYTVCSFWIAILIITIAASFIFSVFAYVISKTGG